MRVFVTGASGFVGSAVVRELIAHGHEVAGLARSETGAAVVAEAGAEVVRGTLDDLDILGRAAGEAEAVIHTAFDHDFSHFVQSCAQDRRAIEALGEALEGTGKALIVTSGVALLAAGRPANEEDVPPPRSDFYPRVSEATGLAFTDRDVKAMTVRLAPSVHGDGEAGFVPILIGLAKRTGVAAYVGDGSNRWPGVARADAARLYRLALEKGVAGRRYHGVAEEGVPLRAITELIGRRLGVPVESRTPEEASAHFGWFALFAGADSPASSAITQSELGWTPSGPGLLADIDQELYFAA